MRCSFEVLLRTCSLLLVAACAEHEPRHHARHDAAAGDADAAGAHDAASPAAADTRDAAAPDGSVIMDARGQAPVADAACGSAAAPCLAGHDAGSDAACGGATSPCVPGHDAGSDAGCRGPAPQCFVQCSGDAVYDEPARCVGGGSFHCDRGFLRSDCPAAACFGVPLPGEVCQAGVWKCLPAMTDTFELCPHFACVTCDGFSGPVTSAGCTCACPHDDGVSCSPQ
ncbi:MAG: hypothetical protein JWN48_3857 [Myxococcaceae bacterium]|nr:hypothetical protein [Myxococcaceae bacterium]